jgi:RNA-splicing ligase RtcB
MSTKHAAGRATVKGQPATLQQAHDLLRRVRPRGAHVSADRWQAFHEEAARVYAVVAQIDTDHHFEALTFAAAAQEDAEKFRAATVPAVRREG